MLYVMILCFWDIMLHFFSVRLYGVGQGDFQNDVIRRRRYQVKGTKRDHFKIRRGGLKDCADITHTETLPIHRKIMRHYRSSGKLTALAAIGNQNQKLGLSSQDGLPVPGRKRTIKLDSLPTEVVHRILSYLDTRGLREVSRTNRHLFSLVDGASLVWSRTLWVEFGVRLRDL